MMISSAAYPNVKSAIVEMLVTINFYSQNLILWKVDLNDISTNIFISMFSVCILNLLLSVK